ncbi:hypothetical protein DICPUDRAFT_48998 [Dictyostelium purpureum]|uniref:Glycine cleavage system H protein n=1 Tax=Dictyostelium purpureum TaxID=5786 RepID=F0ZRW5_DICPU|nr:uncharacterized protein DICPUDRAFT_48998 [Dictyostelium purpureum]EGC33312.1 hypothetical protein DICPUDRAFT_48998 [Dictyostelium purpureum]|eukprot:XP_003290168.1 hypothetical protein DICPUDRAFT_48998 [Dictyostelium purpureum]
MLSRLNLSRVILANKSLFFNGVSRNYCTRYTDDHEWVKLEGNQGTLGITNFAQKQLGDIVFVELPNIRKHEAGEPICVIESVKAASDVFSPFEINVTEGNMELTQEPELVNSEPYASWIIKFTTNDTDGFKKLLTLAEYEKLIGEKEDTSN